VFYFLLFDFSHNFKAKALMLEGTGCICWWTLEF